MVAEVQPISSIPTQYVERHITYKVWDGQLVEGSEKALLISEPIIKEVRQALGIKGF